MSKREVAGELNLLFDPSFSDIKDEAFCQWILEAVEEESSSGDGCNEDGLARSFARRLGVRHGDHHSKVDLERQFSRALDMAVKERKWVRADFRRRGLGSEAKEASRGERVFLPTPLGMERLEAVASGRDESLRNAYLHFCGQCCGHLQQADRESSVEELAVWLERRFSESLDPLLVGEDDSAYSLWDCFVAYVGQIEMVVVHNIVLPVSRALPTAVADAEPAAVLEDAFQRRSFRDGEEVDMLWTALEKTHSELCHAEEPTGDLGYWFYRCAAERMISKVLPYKKSVREALDYEALASVTVYLDTNFIIALLSERDVHHRRAVRIFKFLRAHGMGFAWARATERELNGNLRVAAELVKFVGSQLENERHLLTESVATLPSFVSTFFEERWADWETYQSVVLDRYRRLRAMSQKEILDSLLEDDLREEWNSARKVFSARLVASRGRSSDAPNRPIEHDAQALAAVQILRESMPSGLISEGDKLRFQHQEIPINSPFWLVTFDSSLLEVREDGPGKEGLPLALFFSAVISLYDPYVMARYLHDVSEEEVRAPYVRSREDIVRVVRQAKDRLKVSESVREMIERVNEYAVEEIT